MSALIVRADAARLPLPDESVDLIVTSPPYFALRSYTDGGEHVAGQIGSEPTPREYIEALLACTREWVRVLKSSGSIFINLGDKYSGAPSGPRTPMGDGYIRDHEKREFQSRRRVIPGVPNKSLMLLPERYRIGCVDQLGLIARAVICWSKPNGLPESVTDRVRRSHEDWVHLTKEPRYFSAVDAIREQNGRAAAGAMKGSAGTIFNGDLFDTNPLGKLPGSVWDIATEPLRVPEHLGVDHFAAFPTEWPRRLILGWSPSGICTACGEGRRPVSVSTITADRGGRQFNPTSGNVGVLGKEREHRITGEACACPEPSAPTHPAIVLDPFGGTGTTALVASVLGRTGISADLSHDYARLAQWRTTDPGERARAMRVPKPPKQTDGQLDMFDGAAS